MSKKYYNNFFSEDKSKKAFSGRYTNSSSLRDLRTVVVWVEGKKLTLFKDVKFFYGIGMNTILDILGEEMKLSDVFLGEIEIRVICEKATIFWENINKQMWTYEKVEKQRSDAKLNKCEIKNRHCLERIEKPCLIRNIK